MSRRCLLIQVERSERGLLIRENYSKSKLMRHMAGVWDKAAGGWFLPERLDILGKLDQIGCTFSPDVILLRQQLEEQQLRLTEAKLDGHTTEQSMPVKTKPFNHQQVAYQVATTLPAAALLMEQGTGKTLTAIAVAGYRHIHNGVRCLLVVCPASVVPVWPREFAEHANYRHRVVPLIASSAVEKIKLVASAMEQARPDELTVIVVNFESAWRIESVLERVVKGQMIVVDESQRIKTPGAEQSKCLHRLGKLSQYRLILSGTPITQNPMDLYSQYKFLEPSLFGGSFTVFRNRYAIMGGFEGRQIVEYQRLDELMAKAHSIAYRITKAEALDLPDELTQIVPVILPPKVQKMYRELKQHSIVELEKEIRENDRIVAANVLTKLLRLQQLAGGWVNTDENGLTKVHEAKLVALRDHLETLLEDETRKVVIFARFLPEIHAITDMLSSMRLDHRWITGAVGQAERGEAVQDFQTDPDVRVFTAQIQTAGLGITLTAADTAIFFSMDFSLANHEQAKARIHRIGQKKTVTYMYLLTAGSVDEKIFEALKSKKSIADQVVDDWRSVM